MDLSPRAYIDGLGRFIAQPHLRVRQERPGKDDLLLITARKFPYRLGQALRFDRQLTEQPFTIRAAVRRSKKPAFL